MLINKMVRTFFVITMFASPKVYGIDNVTKAIAMRLTARYQSLSEGSIQYEHYEANMSHEQYKNLRSIILNSQFDASPMDIVKRLRAVADSNECRIWRGYEGTMYYKNDDSTERWRLTRETMLEFYNYSHLVELAKKNKKDLKKISIERERRTQDAAYDGKHVISVNNNKEVVYYEHDKVSFPQINSLDISLSQWRMMAEKGANPGQTISTSTKDGICSLVFDNKTSSATYKFDSALGYAPLSVRAESKGKDVLEILYAYKNEYDDNFLPRPCLSSTASFKPNGTVGVTLWAFESWLPEVTEDDLEVKLPEEYTLVDHRFGQTPLITRINVPDLPPLEESTMSNIEGGLDNVEIQGPNIVPEMDSNVVPGMDSNMNVQSKDVLAASEATSHKQEHRLWKYSLLFLIIFCAGIFFLRAKIKKEK